MQALDCIATRRSVRKFTEQLVEQEKLDIILKAAQASPIGHSNYKGIHITVVQNQEILKAYDEAAAAAWGKANIHLFYNAPTLIVVSCKPEDPQFHVYAEDAGCIMQNMQLAATELDLGCVFLWGLLNRIPQDPAFVQALGLPEGFRPECCLALGYPQAGFELKPRTLEEVLDRIQVSYVR